MADEKLAINSELEELLEGALVLIKAQVAL